jgi:glutathione S-transferase
MLTLYIHPVSQPARTVHWLMLARLNATDFKTVVLNPGSPKPNGSRSPSFLAKTGGIGTVPTLELETGTCICESNAILTYLAQRFNWEDIYSSNLEQRAKIDSLLHWHHANLRKITTSRFAPLVRLDLHIPEKVMAADYNTAQRALRNIEARLNKHKFLCGDTVTLADFAASGEILQCLPEFCDNVDFQQYPATLRWTEEMMSFPKFKESHAVLKKFASTLFKKNWKKANRSKL